MFESRLSVSGLRPRQRRWSKKHRFTSPFAPLKLLSQPQFRMKSETAARRNVKPRKAVSPLLAEQGFSRGAKRHFIFNPWHRWQNIYLAPAQAALWAQGADINCIFMSFRWRRGGRGAECYFRKSYSATFTAYLGLLSTPAPEYDSHMTPCVHILLSASSLSSISQVYSILHHDIMHSSRSTSSLPPTSHPTM